MADVLKRVAGPVALTATAATVYTCAATTGCVLRSIHVANETSATVNFSLSIGTDGAGKRLWYLQPVNAYSFLDWTGNIVLATAELLQSYASVAASLTLVISGVEY